jgi:ubiquinone/menaquinone biosynthesis C-methylase UbiE
MSYWKDYWNNVASHKSPLMQVQRDAISESKMLLIEEHICSLLDLHSDDTLLDVCCGNGLITKRLARHCKQIVGVDFSKRLIAAAQENTESKNLSFIEEDATRLASSLDLKFDKILLYFSFQYLNTTQGALVISEMKTLLKPGGIILIGDIPDQKKFWVYYDSFLKRAFYFKQWLLRQPKMGKFWSVSEMDLLAQQNNLKGKYLCQNTDLPHSHYRFDYLMIED